MNTTKLTWLGIGVVVAMFGLPALSRIMGR